MRKIRVLLLLSLQAMPGWAQEDSVKTTSLREVIVSGYRIPVPKNALPYSVTSLDFRESKRSMQQLSLNEFLVNAPGVFILNANNFAQDMRVSIRGFGARSAFGIRGIKIVVDGIPETTPDGQGQIDNLNLGIIDRIEIIRGASSALYGNASGGVIHITTQDSVERNVVSPSIGYGSFGLQQYQLSAGFKQGKARYLFHGSTLRTDGYREQSGFETYNFNAKVKYRLQRSSSLTLQANYVYSPYADDAGGLTAQEVEEDRQQARQRNVDFRTREEVEQVKIGASFVKSYTRSTFNTYAFYIARAFWASLPFESSGIVDLTRDYFGQGANYSLNYRFRNWKHQLQVGYDMAYQLDDRTRFQNLNGEEQDRSFEQLETFRNLGAFVLNHIHKDAWRITLGARYDINLLAADDRYLADSDQSGDIDYYTFSPSIGVSYELTDNHFLHTNFSAGFETPALSELSANPDGAGGFTTLEPQFTENYEIGYKASTRKTSVEASVFYIASRGDLVPYELEAFPGRTFYRNAGSTTRTGLELSYSQRLTSRLNVLGNYTFSDFRYGSYVTPEGDADGNTLPGIPNHLVAVQLNYAPVRWMRLNLNTQYRGALYVNDQNTVQDEDVVVANINASFNYALNRITLQPYLGINNFLNTRYNDNIRINAFGGRYYEPAPGISMYVGLRARI